MMRLPQFDYQAPRTIEDAIRIKSDTGVGSMFVAGGTDLYPNMKRRQQTPGTVISVSRIKEFHRIEGNGETGVRIGPGVSLTEIVENSMIQGEYPVVAEAARTISTPILRNMGTIGGNLLLDTRCNYYDQNYEWRRGINFCMKKDGNICWVAPSSPRCWAVQSSDLAPVMVALGAHFKFASPSGERTIEAKDLYNHDGINYLHKKPDELLTEIALPPRDSVKAVYKKLRRRGAFDFPVLGVAAAITVNGDGTVNTARVVLGGVAPAPIEVEGASESLVGKSMDDESISAAVEACYIKARPLDNTDFVMGWRKKMTRPFVKRALEEIRANI